MFWLKNMEVIFLLRTLKSWLKSCTTPAVILFEILGSYLFLHIWEKYFIKIRKISAKIHKIGKIKAIFGLGMTPI